MGHDQDHPLDCTTNHTACTDNTDLNVSITAHGLAPKLSGVVTQYLSGNGSWLALPSGGYPYICLQDQKAQNTHGGTFTAGAWRTRDLTVEQSDAGAHCSLAANQFTLSAGDYVILAAAPTWHVGYQQVKLYNATDAADLIIGTANYAGEGAFMSGAFMGMVFGRFTVAASKALEIQHRCSQTRANDGFGAKCNWTTEVYTQVQLWKVA